MCSITNPHTIDKLNEQVSIHRPILKTENKWSLDFFDNIDDKNDKGPKNKSKKIYHRHKMGIIENRNKILSTRNKK